MNSNFKNFLSFKTIIRQSLILLFSILFVFLLNSNIFSFMTAYGGKSFIIPSFNSKNDVYSGGSDYIPDLSEYPFTSDTLNAVGFDTLYDSSKDFFVYKGEIPYILYSNKDYEKWAGKYRYFDGEKIGNHERPWASDNLRIDSEDKLKESYDPHIDSMRREQDGHFLYSILFAVVKVIYYVTSVAIKLCITIQNFDISTLLNLVDGDGSLSKQLSKMLLIDPDGGISPFLLFGLIVFIFSFISMSFKAIKGDQRTSFRKLLNEFLFFVLAIAIASIFLIGSNTSYISNIGTNILNKLSVDIVASSDKNLSIFMYNTGNTKSDTLATQKAILNKIFIDQIIKSNFGFPVDELDIFDSNGNSDFGDSKIVKTALQNTFKNGGTESFSVCTDIDKINKVNNLGYYLYAANSGVKISKGTGGSTAAFAKDGSSISTATSDRALFVIDFLSYLRKEYDGNNQAMVNKIDKITRTLNNPNYLSVIWSVFLISIQNAALALSLIGIILFSIIGQLIVVFGSYCMVVLPVLLLFNGTRKLAEQMTWSYLFGFLRYLIGSVLFNIVLLISSLLCSSGETFAIVASGVIAYLLYKFLPTLLIEANNQISQIERGRGISQLSGAYRKMNNLARPFTLKEKSARRAAAMIKDENGNLKPKGTITDRIQTGLEKGFKFQKTGINPFGDKRKKYNEERLKEIEENKVINEEDFENSLFNNFDEIDDEAREKAYKEFENSSNSNSSSLLFGAAMSSLLFKNNKNNADSLNDQNSEILNTFNNYREKGYFELDEDQNVIFDENGLPKVLNQFKDNINKDGLLPFMDKETIDSLNKKEKQKDNNDSGISDDDDFDIDHSNIIGNFSSKIEENNKNGEIDEFEPISIGGNLGKIAGVIEEDNIEDKDAVKLDNVSNVKKGESNITEQSNSLNIEDLNDPVYDIKTRKQARMILDSGKEQKPIENNSKQDIKNENVDSNSNVGRSKTFDFAEKAANAAISVGTSNIIFNKDKKTNNLNQNGKDLEDEKVSENQNQNIIKRGIKIVKDVKQDIIDGTDKALLNAGREDLISENRIKLKESEKEIKKENRQILSNASSGLKFINQKSKNMVNYEKQLKEDKKEILSKLEKIAIESKSGEMNLNKAMDEIKRDLLKEVSAKSMESRNKAIDQALKSITEKEKKALLNNVKEGRTNRIKNEVSSKIKINQQEKDRAIQEEILNLLRQNNSEDIEGQNIVKTPTINPNNRRRIIKDGSKIIEKDNKIKENKKKK